MCTRSRPRENSPTCSHYIFMTIKLITFDLSLVFSLLSLTSRPSYGNSYESHYRAQLVPDGSGRPQLATFCAGLPLFCNVWTCLALLSLVWLKLSQIFGVAVLRLRLKFLESQFQDRVCKYQSFNFENQFFQVSVSRLSPRLTFSKSQYRDRVWDWNFISLSFETESKTERCIPSMLNWISMLSWVMRNSINIYLKKMTFLSTIFKLSSVPSMIKIS